MAITNGDFTSSDRLAVQTKVGQMVSDDAIRSQYFADTGALEALRQTQVNRVTALDGDQAYDDTVKVHWVEHDSLTAGAETTTCTFTGTELGTDSSTYTVSGSREVNTSWRSKDFRTSQFSAEEVAAMSFLAADQALVAWANAQAIAYFEATISDLSQVYDIPGQTTSDNTGVTVPASLVTPSFFGELHLAARQMRYTSYSLLGGGNLWKANWNAQRENGTQADVGQGAKLGSMRMFTELDNLLADSDNPLYLFRNSGHAVINKTKTDPIKDEGLMMGAVSKVADHVKYTVRSQIAPWLNYECYERVACDEKGEWIRHFSYVLRYQVLQAPISDNAATDHNHTVKVIVS